ncbi:N-terminal phage integrase SAM-like domain-containing protein [Bacillus safensis]|uniref:N-terminal phage integrase SAM-like domain-containing protein n=1 Tax=Bacillus safensis TaxID=561879 RepID=UPI00381D1366
MLRSDIEFRGGETTLKHFLIEWLEVYKKGNVAKNTFNIHKRNVENKILPYFKEMKLKHISPIRYQKFINTLEQSGKYSTRTIEIIHSTYVSCVINGC